MCGVLFVSDGWVVSVAQAQPCPNRPVVKYLYICYYLYKDAIQQT